MASGGTAERSSSALLLLLINGDIPRPNRTAPVPGAVAYHAVTYSGTYPVNVCDGAILMVQFPTGYVEHA
jgi:hypothetical protein